MFTVGPIYGHNFGENDNGNVNDLVGGEITYSLLPGFLGGVSLKQDVLYSFNGEDNGANGRSIISLDLAPDLGHRAARSSPPTSAACTARAFRTGSWPGPRSGSTST